MQQAAREVGEVGDALALPTDVTKPDEVEKLVKETVDRYAKIAILINNAGGIGRAAAFEELSDEEWFAVLDLNLFSAVRLTRAVLPHMRQQGWGRIINIASESGIQPDPFMPHYNASKAALVNLTKSLSKAYGEEGILVNAVSPAFVMTPLVESMLADETERGESLPRRRRQHSLKRTVRTSSCAVRAPRGRRQLWWHFWPPREPRLLPDLIIGWMAARWRA